jgi:flagellin FlaB
MKMPKMFIGSRVNEERGITGLETAIVLIAFVVVSSVFAFAALSTGLFSSDQAKETIRAGLSEARGTLELRGAVIAEDTDTDGDVDKVYFQVSNAAGGEPIDLTQGKTIIRYSDSSQSVIFDTSALFSVTPIGDADSDNLLEPGELYEISLLSMESNLATNLANSKTFVIEVIPPQGAVLFIERTTPVVVAKYNDLT